MGQCQVLLRLYPLQGVAAVVGSQQGLPCGYIGTVSTGQKLVADGFPASPYSIQIPHLRHQGPSTYEAILLRHPEQSTVLMRCGLPRSPRGLGWHQSSSGSMPPEDVVDGNTSQTHRASNNSTLLHALTGKNKHFMPYTYRGCTGHYYSNLSQCEGRFGEITTQAVVFDYDPTWHWSESPVKVRPDFVGEQTRVHFMSISAHWEHKNWIHIVFIASNGGLKTFFTRVFMIYGHGSVLSCIFCVTHKFSENHKSALLWSQIWPQWVKYTDLSFLCMSSIQWSEWSGITVWVV